MTISVKRVVEVHASTYPLERVLPAKFEVKSSHTGLLSVQVMNAWGYEKHHIEIDIPASCSLHLQECLVPGDILIVMMIGNECGSTDCLYLQVEQETLVIRAIENTELHTQFQFEVIKEEDSTSFFSSRLHLPWSQGGVGGAAYEVQDVF